MKCHPKEVYMLFSHYTDISPNFWSNQIGVEYYFNSDPGFGHFYPSGQQALQMISIIGRTKINPVSKKKAK